MVSIIRSIVVLYNIVLYLIYNIVWYGMPTQGPITLRNDCLPPAGSASVVEGAC